MTQEIDGISPFGFVQLHERIWRYDGSEIWCRIFCAEVRLAKGGFA
jgi:hypothetical protein